VRYCLLAWLAIASPRAIAADVADLVAYLDHLESFSASFVQTRYDETGELIESARGSCQILRPGRFRWIYTEPYRQVIVADGEKLWIHDEDLEQVTVNRFAAAAPGTPAELLAARIDVASAYVIEERAAEGDLNWYRLTPKQAGGEFSAIELALADGDVRAMRLRDNLGQTTALEFDAIARNLPLDPAAFAFTPPPGVDVIEGGAP